MDWPEVKYKEMIKNELRKFWKSLSYSILDNKLRWLTYLPPHIQKILNSFGPDVSIIGMLLPESSKI